MPTGPKSFLEPPDESGHWSCAWNLLKKASYGWWDVGQIPHTKPRHTSIGRVWECTVLSGSVLIVVVVSRGAPWPPSSSLRGPSLQTLTLLGGFRFIALCYTRPSSGTFVKYRMIILCFLQRLFSGEWSMVYLRLKTPRLRLGNLWKDELHYRHLCHPCIAVDIVVQFKL